jgi:hypothetical protein
MTRAIADLWSQVIESGDDFVIFHDHYGNPARIRIENNEYRIAWVVETNGQSRWDENERAFDSPREAALYAFQGPTLGRSA